MSEGPINHGYSQRFIDKHREHCLDYEWWDHVYQDFWDDMACGIHVESMYFSGFSSQGDGACFEGNIDDFALFMAHHAMNYPALKALLQTSHDIHVSWHQRGRYYHKHSLRFESECTPPDFMDPEVDPDTDDLRTAVLRVALSNLDDEMDAFMDEVEEIVRRYCDTLYANLQREYDFITSDEVVADWMHDNGYIEDEKETAFA